MSFAWGNEARIPFQSGCINQQPAWLVQQIVLLVRTLEDLYEVYTSIMSLETKRTSAANVAKKLDDATRADTIVVMECSACRVSCIWQGWTWTTTSNVTSANNRNMTPLLHHYPPPLHAEVFVQVRSPRSSWKAQPNYHALTEAHLQKQQKVVLATKETRKRVAGP